MLGSASLLKQEGGGSQGTPGTIDGALPGLDAKIQALSQLFEMATTQTHVDHPLCLDCAAQLKDEMDSQVNGPC